MQLSTKGDLAPSSDGRRRASFPETCPPAYLAAFLRWLHGEDELERVPEIPVVKVKNEQRPAVPTEKALER